MPPRSELESHSRLVLGFGMIALGAVWLLKLLWPILLLLLLIGFIAGGYWFLQRQRQKILLQQRREDRLARKFYELLDYRQGRISSLEFAMHTRIDGREARRYLHVQAQAFGGFFERTVNNDIIYIFNPAVIYSYAPQSPVTPAEITWTYTVQVQEKAKNQPLQPNRNKRSQAAWANARQLRAINQLTQPLSPLETEPDHLNTAAEGVSPTVRGKAYSDESIKTIDVAAVNE